MKKSKKILFPILFLISLFIFQLPYKGSPAVTAAYAGSLDAPSDFEAEIFRNYVALSWDNESTGYYYTIIEKSVDQGDFYRIATLYKGKPPIRIIRFQTAMCIHTVPEPFTARPKANTPIPPRPSFITRRILKSPMF